MSTLYIVWQQQYAARRADNVTLVPIRHKELDFSSQKRAPSQNTFSSTNRYITEKGDKRTQNESNVPGLIMSI